MGLIKSLFEQILYPIDWIHRNVHFLWFYTKCNTRVSLKPGGNCQFSSSLTMKSSSVKYVKHGSSQHFWTTGLTLPCEADTGLPGLPVGASIHCNLIFPSSKSKLQDLSLTLKHASMDDKHSQTQCTFQGIYTATQTPSSKSTRIR